MPAIQGEYILAILPTDALHQESIQGPPGVGHKIEAPVQPLRGPWDKYSPQEVEETDSTKPQESPPGDEARSGQVAHTNTPSTAEDRG